MRTFAALITMTWSPVSRNGVYLGLSLPERMRATRVASRPSVWSSASMTNHLRAISPLGKYVDISKLSQNLKKPRKSRSVQALDAQIPSGGQTQDCERCKDSR